MDNYEENQLRYPLGRDLSSRTFPTTILVVSWCWCFFFCGSKSKRYSCAKARTEVEPENDGEGGRRGGEGRGGEEGSGKNSLSTPSLSAPIVYSFDLARPYKYEPKTKFAPIDKLNAQNLKRVYKMPTS